MQLNTGHPHLSKQHIKNASLFADRKDLIAALEQAKGGVVAEVGVAHGEFSQFILETLNPRQFYAFDTFGMHNYPSCWGIPTAKLLDGKTHLDFYKDRFSAQLNRIQLFAGPSHETLTQVPDQTFDLMYIDAGHSYEDVSRDAAISRRKIKENGVLVFNDYIMVDHLANEKYGVVQAVNELVVNDDWKVIGFALHREMFCDIAITKT